MKVLVVFVSYFVNDSRITYKVLEGENKNDIVGQCVSICKKIKGDSLNQVDYKIITYQDLIKNFLK